MYIASGEGSFVIADEEIRYNAGCLIFTPPWIRHSYRALGQKVEHFALHFDISEGYSERYRKYRDCKVAADDVAIEFEGHIRIPFVLRDFDRSCVARFESLIALYSEMELRRIASLPLRMASRHSSPR